MMGRDDEALDGLQGFDELEVLEVLAGCALLDAFKIWGAAIMEAFQRLGHVLAFPVT